MTNIVLLHEVDVENETTLHYAVKEQIMKRSHYFLKSMMLHLCQKRISVTCSQSSGYLRLFAMEAVEDCESVENIDSIFRLLRAYPSSYDPSES